MENKKWAGFFDLNKSKNQGVVMISNHAFVVSDRLIKKLKN